MSEPEVMAMHTKDVLGRSGEQAAAEYLESCGLRILDRNWRCATGEIDIVAVERAGLGGGGGQARAGDGVGGAGRGGVRGSRGGGVQLTVVTTLLDPAA